MQWLDMLQTGFPMCALSALVGPLRLSFDDQRQLATELIPWALRCHKSSRFLLGVDFERRFERDIDEVRNELGIIKAPWHSSNAESYSNHDSDKGKHRS